MIPALKSVVRNLFIRLAIRWPLFGDAFARFLDCIPHPGAAARLCLWIAHAKGVAGDRDGAISFCDKAIARRPSLTMAFLLRGELYIGGDEYAPAVADLQRALACAAGAGGDHLLPRIRDHLFRCHEALGQLLASDGQPAAALEHYDAALALQPDVGILYLRRGECRHAAGLPELALDDYLTALNHRPDQWQMIGLLYALGRLLACEGGVEEGVAYYFVALGMREQFEKTRRVHWGTSGRSSGRLDHARLVLAHDVLAADLMNWFGALDAARQVFRNKLDLQERLAPSGPLTDLGALILPADWVRQIGHMGFLDTWLKMNLLGWRSWRKVFLLAPPGRVANRHYLTYWDRHLTVITDPVVCESLAPLAQAHAFPVASGLYLPGSTELLYFCEALGVVQKEWEAQGRAPLLTLSDADERRGRDALEKMGVPRDAWFVCLHVRGSSFHKAGDSKHQAHRDADVLDYQLAIREVAEHGGWVFRMGDPTMPPLPEMERVIDYAHSPAKADWLDVFLCGRCRFFVGLASGLSQVAVSFGVPCVYVNWISNVLPAYSAKDVFIPKLFRSGSDDRIIPFAEMYDPSALNLNCNNYLLLQHGLEVVDNESTEIRDAVLEMMDQLDGTRADSEEDRRLQERFDRVLAAFGHKGYCRMAKAFLHKQSGLLPDVAPPALHVPAAA